MVKRYDVYADQLGDTFRIISDHGDCVDYSDYASLLQSHARLLAALKLASDHFLMLYPDARGDDFLVDTCDSAIAAAQPFTET